MKLHKLVLVFLQFSLANSTPAVIIVGAGSAGIAAGTRLLEHNFTDLVILEAENRIGGRVNSIFFGKTFIDLGAEWCHGEKDNIVHELVKDFNVLRHTEEVSEQIFYSSRKNIDEEFSKDLLNIIDRIYVPDGHRDVDESRSLGNYCIEKYNTSIHEKYQKEPEKLEIAKSAIDLFHHMVIGSEGSFSWFEPSAKSDYKDCEGDLNLNWNGLGYKTALDVLMKKFPDPSKQLPFDNKVFLNKEVIKVSWNKNLTKKSITVVCADQTMFEGDYVIFTPSIGVLKQQHKKMFSPPLPKSKIDAIKQIGFGAVMKVVMHFKSRWWPISNFTGFRFIWSEDDKHQIFKEFPKGPFKNGRSWLTELYSIRLVEHNSNVLIGWLTGDMIPQIEKMANETMVDGITFFLNKFLGHKYNVTAPDAIIRTSWYSNPHFRGSYSYQTVEARKNNVTAELELAKPLLNIEGRPILMFAGEASHSYFYSTVHGAIETGYREANRLINLYNK